MKIKLLPKEIVETTSLDNISEQYQDCSILEVVYEVWKLRTAILIGDSVVEATVINDYGQIRIDGFDAPFSKHEYEVIEE